MSTGDDRSAQFAGVLGSLLVLCIISVLLRCYFVSLVIFIIFSCFAFLGLANGTGKRKILIPVGEYPIGIKWWWACEPTYVLTGMASKISIFIFLLRITVVERVHRIILWITIITIEVYSFSFFLLFIFQCWPISYFWGRFRGDSGSCINPHVVVSSFYAYSTISCITDWTFSVVPIFLIWNMKMNRESKILVGGILAFCAIGSTATIVRLPYISGLNDEEEFLYSTIGVAIWSTCETGVGISVSSIATLRPLFRLIFHSSKSRCGSSGKNSNATPTRKYIDTSIPNLQDTTFILGSNHTEFVESAMNLEN